MADGVVPHRFGGAWTEVKLDAVQYYLECYAKALTSANMDIWYVDAFAGSGERETTKVVGGLLEGAVIEEVTETLDGSARRAMQVEPPFKHFIFIENDAERCAALERLKDAGHRDVQVIRGEANRTLRGMIERPPWVKKDKSKSRGVVFLDPYATEVDWVTLRALAQTMVLDVWYLFPLNAVVRQLARDFSGVGNKEAMLDRVLSPAWRELYKLPPPDLPGIVDMFQQQDEEQLRREASVKQIEEWFRAQLAGVFAYVPEPVRILKSQNVQLFSLFLCVSNPSAAATDLADKFMRYVKKGRRPASRRRSAP